MAIEKNQCIVLHRDSKGCLTVEQKTMSMKEEAKLLIHGFTIHTRSHYDTFASWYRHNWDVLNEDQKKMADLARRLGWWN